LSSARVQLTGTGFRNIQNLTGGTAADTFVFQGGGRLTGSIDGGAQANAAARNTLQGSDLIAQWVVNGADQGTLTGPGGTALIANGFAQIGNLTGGNQSDTFTLDANGRLSGTLDGGAQDDPTRRNTLRGPDVQLKWTINGPDAGQVTDTAGNV